MNDTELDQLLDTWEAPAPPLTLRTELRDRFPRAERRRFPTLLRWTLAVAVASAALAALAVGMEQSDKPRFDFMGARIRQFYRAAIDGLETRRAADIRNRIRESHPRAYVDGTPAGPIQYRGGASMWLEVPGEGLYGIMMTPGPRHGWEGAGPPPHVPQGKGLYFTTWQAAGRLHGSVLEFPAGSKQVRIECDRPIVDTDRPVYVLCLP